MEVAGAKIEWIVGVMAMVGKQGVWTQLKRRPNRFRLYRCKATLHGIELHVVEGLEGSQNTLSLNTHRWHVRLYVSDSKMFIPKELHETAVYFDRIPASIGYDGFVYKAALVSGAQSFKHDMTILYMFEEESFPS